MAEAKNSPHTVKLENREKLYISGVEDVLNFDDTGIVLKTSAGILSVDGSELRITAFNVDDGNIEIFGTVNGIIYPQAQRKRQSILRRG